MRTKHWWVILLLFGLALRAPGFNVARSAAATPGADDPSPPASPVKLIFIHHSCGENWLGDSDGGLGIALRDANYFVSDTNYGWTAGGDAIGDTTDIGHWHTWFLGSSAITYTAALYTEYGQHATYSRLASDPGGENEIIMFKSCYPNSHLGGNQGDPIPPIGSNPLRGQDAYSEHHTISNAKGIYNALLDYFATQPGKLFVVITAPPLQAGDTDASHAANARAFNDWLVNDWLAGYGGDNVAVFDFYNVLTSNGGDANTNDLGDADGNHHRWTGSAITHTQTVDSDTAAYPGGSGGGSHPTSAGNQKATGEFVSLLNVYYHRWAGSAPPAPTLTLAAPNGGESWTVGTQHDITWASTGNPGDVSLHYSTDGFATEHVIAASTADDGSHPWTVPDDASSTARVRVASVMSPTTVFDESDADFSIVAGSGAQDYTFQAQIAPANATEPVSYAWSPEPASGQGTATATYSWAPGTYSVTVQATNCGGTFDDAGSFTVGSQGLAGAPPPAPAAARATAELVAVADVILAADADENANLGGLENLETFYGDAENRRSLLRWDLSGLPAGITVSAATVSFYRYGGDAESPMPVALYRVTRAWDEGTGYALFPEPSYVPDGATWLTATAGTAWTAPGGDYDSTSDYGHGANGILDQTTLLTDTGRLWLHLDATAAAQAWVAGSQPNHGLLLRALGGQYTYHYFHSREAVTATLRPRLTLTYTTGAPAPALAITAPAAGTSWPVSTTQQIAWTTTGVVTRVNLAYSLGGGFVAIESDVANATGSNTYAWTTPVTATASAQVRVESVISPSTVYDVSDAFTLYASAATTGTLYAPLMVKAAAPPQACLRPLTGVTLTGPFTQTAGARLQPADLVYRGAFAYPAGDDWAYSGHALAYYPGGDPAGPSDGYPGSLYAAAHDQQDLVGEMSIPVPVDADEFAALPQATSLRALADITGGWIANCTYHAGCIYREVDGLAYLPNVGKIAWNLRDWYNVTAYDQDSLGWSALDLSGAQGVWHIGPRPSTDDEFHNAKTCNYLFKAPAAFAAQHLEDKWLIAGSPREAGALGGSQGPTLFAVAPWEDGAPPAAGQTLDALALLYYPEIYPGCYDDPTQCHYPNYRATDDWGGGAWVQAAGKSAVLIVGRKGLGANCYGTPAECGGDPCAPSKGYHAYPYQPQILFYDPDELRAVVEGSRQPWDVVPYAIHVPTDEVLDAACASLSAAAYDPDRQLVYITERTAGEFGETVVHVWAVE